MFDHVGLEVPDVLASADALLRALAPIGLVAVFRAVTAEGHEVGLADGTDPSRAYLWLGTGGVTDRRVGVHLAFPAPTRAAVDDVAAAAAAGLEVLHAPRLWPEYGPAYYATFFRDLDGNNVEAVCHAPDRGTRRRVRAAWHGWAARGRRGSIAQVTTSPTEEQRLHDLALLRRVRDRIDREYAQPLDVEALARGVHLSAGHLSRQFRLAYGESPYAYLMTRRIERAMALLRRGDLNVTEVCFAVGCQSLGTFSTRFTELVGVPPSTYRSRTARTGGGGRAGTAGTSAEMPSCVVKQVTRPIRNREARVSGPHLA